MASLCQMHIKTSQSNISTRMNHVAVQDAKPREILSTFCGHVMFDTIRKEI